MLCCSSIERMHMMTANCLIFDCTFLRFAPRYYELAERARRKESPNRTTLCSMVSIMAHRIVFLFWKTSKLGSTTTPNSTIYVWKVWTDCGQWPFIRHRRETQSTNVIGFAVTAEERSETFSCWTQPATTLCWHVVFHFSRPHKILNWNCIVSCAACGGTIRITHRLAMPMLVAIIHARLSTEALKHSVDWNISSAPSAEFNGWRRPRRRRSNKAFDFVNRGRDERRLHAWNSSHKIRMTSWFFYIYIYIYI